MAATDPDDDEPLSELEAKLASVMKGLASEEELLRAFVDSHVYIMVNGEPQGGTLGDKQPMVIAISAEAPRLMAVFSSPKRAKALAKQFSEYSFPILVTGVWVLEHIGAQMGVTFNPGCPMGFELAPEGAHQLQRAIAEARAQSSE